MTSYAQLAAMLQSNHGLKLQRITSMSRVRFEELLAQINDGSLLQHWDSIDESNMTKGQQVEARQIKAMYAVFLDAPETFRQLQQDTSWKELEVLQGGDKVYLRAKLRNEHNMFRQRRPLCHR